MANIVNNQPPKFEWRVYRGDSTDLTVAALDDNGNQFDLSDYELEGAIREYPTDANVIDNLTIEVTENIINISLPTLDLPTMSYFDVQATNNTTGKITTLLAGSIFLDEDVTR